MKITRSSQFKKCFKKYQHNKSVIFELKQVINCLALDEPLPEKYLDHELKGKFKGLRELHLKPDHLLVYRVEKKVITLIAIGNHSNIFK